MRRGTVRTGLRMFTVSCILFLLGTVYGPEVGLFLSLSGEGMLAGISLAFFWGGILGGVALVQLTAGLLLPARPADRTIRLLPSLLLALTVLVLLLSLFGRGDHQRLDPKQLRPGEVIVI
jgi:hypothetical protein